MSAAAKGPTRQQLRAQARELGLPHSGSKGELEARIKAALENGQNVEPPDDDAVEVDAIIQVLVKRDGQSTVVDVVPTGDVRLAEVPTLLEVAVGRARANAGLG